MAQTAKQQRFVDDIRSAGRRRWGIAEQALK